MIRIHPLKKKEKEECEGRSQLCCNPTLRECEDETHSWNGDLGVLRDSRNFKVQLQRSKHLALGCSLYDWKTIEV
jgi:hypothetical protein